MFRRTLALVPIVAMLAAGVATTADAATPRAASGDRCSIVGTAKADVLVGTAKRDVICGLGGNDVLRGLGGDDVLDEGPGRGRVSGGAGDDVLYGGNDDDRLSGGDGADRLAGGSGTDNLDGDRGNDRLTGGSGGDDLDGGGDADSVAGGTGRDTVAGGSGNDVLRGDDDRDRLLGGSGNDDLDGGAGADGLDGGAGTNWCVVAAEDTQKACVYDATAPRVLEIRSLTPSVDVTDAGRDVVLRAHVVDDTGIDWVFLTTEHVERSSENRLVSGTLRDGWWETTVHVRRYSPGGPYPAHFQVKDRVGRHSNDRFEDVLTVVDRTPDTTPAVVSDVRIAPAEVDVRKAAAKVTVTARITDDISGVNLSDAFFHVPDGRGGYVESGVVAKLARVSGTAQDGGYRATVEIPKGAPGGTWSIAVGVGDVAGNGYFWYLGEDLWRSESGGATPGADPTSLPGGRLLVTGSALDTSPPTLVEAHVDSPSVDTLLRGATVNVDLHVRDTGDGVLTNLAVIKTPEVELFGEVTQVSGTIFDGWWRARFVLPQGLPPGTYTPNFTFQDHRNTVGFVGPAGGGTAGTWRTASGDAWDGSITVVVNPAAGV